MTRASPLFSGVAVSLPNIFQNSGDVDGPATAQLAGRLVEAGVRAVVVGDIWG